MAETGWTAQVAAAAGVAAGTGAAQLGLGYGLGVVEWPAVPAADSVWLGSLGWATWIAASSTVFGAVIAGRLGRTVGGPWRFALAVSAAVGALLTVALIALPARAAVRTETFAPQTIAGGYAVIGVLLGLVIAYWAVVSRPVAANLIATAAWLWSLAVAAVVTTIFWHRPSSTYLSSWQFVSPDIADAQYGIISWPSALLTLLAAFAVGILGVLAAIRRGDLGVGAASSGAVGPLLVAAAFFVLAPQLTGTPGPLQSAYLIAPYAVLAGLAGSAFAVAVGRRQAVGDPAARIPSDQAELGSGSLHAAKASGGAVSASAADANAGGAGPGNAGAVSAGAGSTGADSPGVGSAGAGSAGAGGSADAGTGDAGSRSATAVVPSPRRVPAATAKSRSDSAPPVVPDAADADAEPRPRKSFMSRFRRKNAGQESAPATGEPSAVATGRAQAPSSSMPSPEAAAAPEAGAVSADQPPAARSRSRGSASTQSATAQPASGQPASGQPASGPSASGQPAASPSAAARPVSARSRVPSVDGGARPATSSAPGRSDSRSTVAPPPASPPIAKINDPRSDEKPPPAPRKPSARPSGNPAPGSANVAGSDKTPSPRKTPTKATKATPAAGARPGASPKQAAPARPQGAGASPSARPEEADTAELPLQEPRRPRTPRPGEEETR